MTLPIAILAGGMATRIRPVTERIPKALVEVAGEPFAFHQLRLLARSGIERVVYLLGHLGEQVEEVVGDGSRFGLQVEYCFDGQHLLGTAGAVARACPLLGERFFVLYGDSYLECDYRAAEGAFLGSGQPALMTVFANFGRWDSSNVEFHGNRIIAYDKRVPSARMTHIDYGLGAFSAAVFAGVSREHPSDLSVLYQQLAAGEQLAAFEVFQRFYEVGSFAGIEELTRHLSAESRP